MTDLKNKTVLVYDNGLFIEFAIRLAREFGTVKYFTPWRSAFPHRMDVAIGEGVPEIERVDNFWDEVDEADLIAFPDCDNADLQIWLRERGYRVWGSGNAQWLELDRIQSRKELKQAGIGIPPTQEVVGMEALRQLVEESQDNWIKISQFRGDFETFHNQSAFISEPFLDMLQKQFGPQSEMVKFVVEDGVEGVEIGWDAHTVDGKYPDLGIYAIEAKDKGLLAVIKKYADLPEEVRKVYDGFAPFLKEGEYRNYFSVELRMEPNKPAVVIDPCCRFGSPCSEAWMEMFSNIGEIVWEGSAGNLVQADPVAKYGALAVITSQWARQNWAPIDIPDEIRQWVKFKNLTVVDDNHYYVPGKADMAEIGVVVGLGDTIEEAISECETRAALISGYSIEIKTESLRESMDAIQQGEELGLTF